MEDWTVAVSFVMMVAAIVAGIIFTRKQHGGDRMKPGSFERLGGKKF